MKKLGELLESRFTKGIGKQIGDRLVEWGNSLTTLPTKVLEKVGTYDLVSSVLDTVLLAIDQHTGNFRQQNHEIPELIKNIPVVGQITSIFSSIRDLIDTAGGIPTNSEAINTLQQQL